LLPAGVRIQEIPHGWTHIEIGGGPRDHATEHRLLLLLLVPSVFLPRPLRRVLRCSGIGVWLHIRIHAAG
jgi:hypothetical protein